MNGGSCEQLAANTHSSWKVGAQAWERGFGGPLIMCTLVYPLHHLEPVASNS